MKIFYRAVALVFACLAAISLLASCKDGGGEGDIESETYSGMPEYDIDNIERYIEPFVYTGLEVRAEGGETAREALWGTIAASVRVIVYPDAQVEYYASQERAKYRYYAQRDGIEYAELLEELGVSEESIYEEARALVRDDLVLAYIIKDAHIELSDAERAEHLDRYAERLAAVYGYDGEYIKTNMTEQVYDAMLYDKTMEYLLLNNTVHTAQDE